MLELGAARRLSPLLALLMGWLVLAEHVGGVTVWKALPRLAWCLVVASR